MVATQHEKQHGSNTTWQQHNMVAAQNMVQTLVGRQQHQGQEGRNNNTSRKAATTVSKSVHVRIFE
jgi:hypothetical protein